MSGSPDDDSTDDPAPGAPGGRTALLISCAILGAAVVLVGLSLRREPPVTFAPTSFEPGPVGDSVVGPVRITLDATHPDRWVYFAFSRGAPIAGPAPPAWDLAFRRFNIRVNGGEGFSGRAGVIDLGDVPFDSVRTVPATGYVTSLPRDSVNPAIDRWYDYGFTSHLLTPKSRVYAIRTSDGRYAKLRFVSYYCPGAQPGCVTVEYVYQGDGGRVILP